MILLKLIPNIVLQMKYAALTLKLAYLRLSALTLIVTPLPTVILIILYAAEGNAKL